MAPVGTPDPPPLLQRPPSIIITLGPCKCFLAGGFNSSFCCWQKQQQVRRKLLCKVAPQRAAGTHAEWRPGCLKAISGCIGAVGSISSLPFSRDQVGWGGLVLPGAHLRGTSAVSELARMNQSQHHYPGKEKPHAGNSSRQTALPASTCFPCLWLSSSAAQLSTDLPPHSPR